MKALIVAESFCSIRDSCLKVEEPCGPQTPHMNSMAIKIEAAAATFLTENCSSCSISKPSVIIAKKVKKWSVSNSVTTIATCNLVVIFLLVNYFHKIIWNVGKSNA